MKATATVTVRLEKADGTIVEATKSHILEAGDNPIFDTYTSSRALRLASAGAVEMIRSGRKDQTQ